MRKGKLEHLFTTGNIEGKRSRGRQRIKIQVGIEALRRCLWMQAIAKSGSRNRLRLQQTWQLKKKKNPLRGTISVSDLYEI